MSNCKERFRDLTHTKDRILNEDVAALKRQSERARIERYNELKADEEDFVFEFTAECPDFFTGAEEDRIRSEFRLASQQDQITAGETETITIEVTNNLDETVTDIEPKLFTDDPLSAPDDIAFVPELKPGETTTIRFEVSVGQDTVPKTYAATVDMRYDDADGESQISDTHRVTITVGEPAETTNPLLIGVAVALLVVLTAGLYAWRLR